MSAASGAETLAIARDLFGPDGKGWTQGVLARNAHGKEVLVDSHNACQYCAIGAIRATTGSSLTSVETLLNNMCLDDYGVGTAEWNDAPGRKAAEVIALFEAAVEEANKWRI